MRISKNILIVYGTVTLVCALIVCALLFAVAKTGLVTIPFFSRWYHGPQPTHAIYGEVLTADQFMQRLQSRMQALAQETPPPYRLRVTETEATGALQSSVQTALRNEEWSQTDIQVAVRPTDLEVTGSFARGFLHPQFLIRFAPHIDKGGLRFEPIAAQVGDYPLPPSWITPALSLLFSRDFGVWTISFGQMHIQNVTLEDGSVDLTIAPS